MRARAQARRWSDCRSDLRPAAALLVGASGLALTLAQCLASRGLRVTIFDPDADAAARLGAVLARLGSAVRVIARPAMLSEPAGVVIQTAAVPLPRDAGRGAFALRLVGGPEPGRTAPARLVAPDSGLVEVYPHRDAARVAAVVAALGGVPLRVPAGHDGPAARLLARLAAAAEALAMAGTAPWELDEAAEAEGFATGPCARMDDLGLDAALERLRALRAIRPDLDDLGAIARMAAEGRLGRKASVGWYRYPGGGGRVVDPLVEDLLREEAHFARRQSRPLPADRLAGALVLAVMDEAAHLLAEGAVSDPAELDLAAVLVAGFPARLGGPVFLAGHWGAVAVQAALAQLAGALPGWPAPAPIWAEAARRGLAVGALAAGPLQRSGASTGDASPVKRPEGP